MKKYAYLFSISLVTALTLGISSCKEDEPATPPKLSFSESTMAVGEDAGTIEVELVLDKPHSKDLRVEYTLSGTASDQHDVGTANADYQVEGEHGLVVIESGQTTGIIEIEILNDGAFEEDETIEIAIFDINTSDVELTANDEIEITITSDDAALSMSFATQTLTVNEADQGLQVEVLLDKPAPHDIKIQYELSGSAIDSVTAWDEELNADYYINQPDYAGAPVSGEFLIKAGESKGIIDMRLYTDLVVEDSDPDTDAIDPEDIIITISPATGVAMADNQMEIQLVQEDGLLVALFWPDPVEEAAGALQADMDLLLRVGDNTTTWLGVLTGSVSEGYEGPEIIFIPKALPFAAYGLSYTYYEGTLDPLDFEVVFIDVVDNALEPQASTTSYEATYTAENKNAWTNVSSTKVVQTFEKTQTGFSVPSAITVPDAGSRVGSKDNFTSTFSKDNVKKAEKTAYGSIHKYRTN